MIVPTALLLLLQATASPARDATVAKEVEAVCKQVLCRSPRPIRLKKKDGTLFEMTPPAPMPIVTAAVVTVVAGETVYVEAKREGERLVELRAVSQVASPDRTLTLQLKQEPSVGDGTGMILKVESPFPGVLKYRLGIMPLDGDRLLKTSSCPVIQGSASLEQWPYPIFQAAAAEFRFVEPSSEAARKCE